MKVLSSFSFSPPVTPSEQGEQPVAKVNWKRECLWLYAFVQPQTGQTYWWILPYVNTELFSQVLKDFAFHFGVGQNKHVVLPLDQARWHTSSGLKVTEGIHKRAFTTLFTRITTS